MTVEKRGSFFHYQFMEGGKRYYGCFNGKDGQPEVTLLSSIFIAAIREGVALVNPCVNLPKSVRAKIPARRKRNRYLTVEEERRLFSEGLMGRRKHLREIVETALYTGMRRGEVLRLEPRHINFGRLPVTCVVKGETWTIRPGWLIIEHSKNGQPRLIPLSRRVRRLLERLCRDETCGDYVFTSMRTGGQITDCKHGFTSACAEAELEDFTFHDLRHTWATRAGEVGVRSYIRRAILGHSSASMTDDYTHATPDAMEEAMELVADYAVHYGKITAKRRKRRARDESLAAVNR